MAVLIPGRPGMTYIMMDWWKKESINNVLYAIISINFLSTVNKMKKLKLCK